MPAPPVSPVSPVANDGKESVEIIEVRTTAVLHAAAKDTRDLKALLDKLYPCLKGMYRTTCMLRYSSTDEKGRQAFVVDFVDRWDEAKFPKPD